MADGAVSADAPSSRSNSTRSTASVDNLVQDARARRRERPRRAVRGAARLRRTSPTATAPMHPAIDDDLGRPAGADRATRTTCANLIPGLDTLTSKLAAQRRRDQPARTATSHAPPASSPTSGRPLARRSRTCSAGWPTSPASCAQPGRTSHGSVQQPRHHDRRDHERAEARSSRPSTPRRSASRTSTGRSDPNAPCLTADRSHRTTAPRSGAGSTRPRTSPTSSRRTAARTCSNSMLPIILSNLELAQAPRRHRLRRGDRPAVERAGPAGLAEHARPRPHALPGVAMRWRRVLPAVARRPLPTGCGSRAGGPARTVGHVGPTYDHGRSSRTSRT